MTILLKDLDILGVNPVLYVDGSRRKKSAFGAIASILTCLLMMGATIYFCCEVFFRNSFILIYNQITNYNPAFNFSDYPLAFGFFDTNSKPLEGLEDQIRVWMELQNLYPSEDSNQKVKFDTTLLKLEKCELKKHFTKYANLFKKYSYLETYYCIPTGKLNLTLYGNWADALNPNSFLTIKFAKCFNDQANVNDFPEVSCRNISEIDKNLFGFVMNMLYLDYDINHSNVDNPVNIISRSESFSFSSSVFFRYHIRKKIVNYQTDYGFLFPNIVNEVFFQDDYMTSTTDLRVNTSPRGIFGHTILSLSNKTDNFSRTYTKIQNALANIGGIVEGIFFFFSVLVKFLLKKNYYSELGLSCYGFSRKQSENVKYVPVKFRELKQINEENYFNENEISSYNNSWKKKKYAMHNNNNNNIHNSDTHNINNIQIRNNNCNNNLLMNDNIKDTQYTVNKVPFDSIKE